MSVLFERTITLESGSLSQLFVMKGYSMIHRIAVSLLFMSLVSFDSSAQWYFNNGGLYYNGGPVGIGTNTPGYLLQLKGANDIKLDITGGVGAALRLNCNSVSAWEWQATNSSTLRLNRLLPSIVPDVMSVRSDGHVAINTPTTSCDARLNISSKSTDAYGIRVDANSLSGIRVEVNSTPSHAALEAIQNGTGYALLGNGVPKGSFAGFFQGNVLIYPNDNNPGNLFVSGNLTVAGVKNFVQNHPYDSTKQIFYVSVESGEALTVTRGIAQTKYGVADICLPECFSTVTSSEAPLTVQLTVEMAPVFLYVVEKSVERISIKAKSSDFQDYGDVTFDYFVQGIRAGYENYQAIRDINSEPQNKIDWKKNMETIEKALPKKTDE